MDIVPGFQINRGSFIACGMFMLYENLAGAITWLSHVLGANNSDSLGLLPTVVLAFSQLLQADAPKCQCVLQGFAQHLSVSSWPLLLMIVGPFCRGIQPVTRRLSNSQQNEQEQAGVNYRKTLNGTRRKEIRCCA